MLNNKRRKRFKAFAEAELNPLGNSYQGRKFEEFLKETDNVACLGCGQTALNEYEVVDPIRGILKCPRCFQFTDLKTMMKAWLGMTAEGLAAKDFFKEPFN